MDNYHTSLGIMVYLRRKSKADLSLMTMTGRVTPISCKSGDESAQSQKWSACCWTSCILQPIQFGQLGEYSGSTTSTLGVLSILLLQPENLSCVHVSGPRLTRFRLQWFNTFLSRNLLMFSVSNLLFCDSIQFFIFNAALLIVLLYFCFYSLNFRHYFTSSCSPQSWEPKRKKMQGVSNKVVSKHIFLVVSY